MAAAASAIAKLRPIEISPSTIQYHLPRHVPGRTRPQYVKKFYPNDDAKATLAQPWLRHTDPAMPPYPYGKNTTFEEANHGLYGGSTIQSGHKISDGRNKGKTLRKWYPNVRVERLKSDALNVEMSIPTTARVMRTIRKCGGLDAYLLGEKPARIKDLGLLGWKLRWMVLKSAAVKAKHAQLRQDLGLTSSNAVDATFSDAWADPQIRQTILQKMSIGWEALKDKDVRFQKHIKETLGWGGAAIRRLKGLRSLDVYDPSKMVLPSYVDEEASKNLKGLEVPAGFGIVQVQDAQGEWKGIEEGVRSLKLEEHLLVAQQAIAHEQEQEQEQHQDREQEQEPADGASTDSNTIDRVENPKV